MRRRQFVKVISTAAGAGLLSSCLPSGSGKRSRKPRVLVLAFDGLDPKIVQALIDLGRLPNLAKLAAKGSFRQIATSNPAQTPVAFSNIISGTDPGTHQVYDFIHRRPNPANSDLAVEPFFSTSDAVPAEQDWQIPLGKWRLPLSGAETQLLRRGPSFWDALIQRGVDTSVYYIPSNYPPQEVEGEGRFRCISGMGTPDLLGTYGTFTMYRPDAPSAGREVSGGRFQRLMLVNHRGRAKLHGPPNMLRKPDEHGLSETMSIEFEVVRDPSANVAKIDIDGRLLLLNQGEWSEWVQVAFPTGMPASDALNLVGAPTRVPGIVRFLLKQVHPTLELYASPVNIDPSAPVNPISTPADFSGQLAEQFGLFYTAGLPEDTHALRKGALSEDDFIGQSDLVMDELTRQYHGALDEFEQGCLFFYFGWPDLMQHIFWRDRDPRHPGRDPDQGDRYLDVVDEVYTRLDAYVASAFEVLGPEDTLLVLSDHGFTTFRRGFNLNTWLVQNGYIHLTDPLAQEHGQLFEHVDWTRTTAYGLGMNTLYLNLAGREKFGCVAEEERRRLAEELRTRLLTVRDPAQDGAKVIDRVDLVEDLYPGADGDIAPDLLIGYANGYRVSWDSILGQMPLRLIEDNQNRWSGTHLVAPDLVPGILLSNRKIVTAAPSVSDIAPSILGLFGVEPPKEMTGRSFFAGG